MGAWVDTVSEHFAARHDEADTDDVLGVLDLLEEQRERLARRLPFVPDDIDVVVHGSRAQLYAAQPELPVILRLTAPAARRYLTGWPGQRQLHILAPRHLRARASKVPGSQEMALLAPAAFYTQLVVGANTRLLPPPFTARSLARLRTWAWLWAGAGQVLSGQIEHVRPAIARRLHEGPTPSFPPSMADALLLGGSVLDLLAREEGEPAVLRLILDPDPGSPKRALERAFGGRSVGRSEEAWRAMLGHLRDVARPVERRIDRADDWGLDL